MFGSDGQLNTADLELHQKLDEKCFEVLDGIVGRRISLKNDGIAPSEVAALCIMKARKEVGLTQWPIQLKIVTR